MSDIEEDIKKLKVRFLNINWIYGNTLGITRSQYEEIKGLINNILSEREADKKRIKELEEENKIYVLNGDNVKLEIYIKNNYIPVKKVKDYLKEEQEKFEVYKKESKTNENLKLGMYKHLGAKNMCEKILGIDKNIVTLD